MAACQVCHNSGYLLDDMCPLCDGENVLSWKLNHVVEIDSSIASTEACSRDEEDRQSLTSSSLEFAQGEYRGKLISYKQNCFGTIACEAVEGGVVNLSATNIVGPEPGNCNTQRGCSPAGPTVTFDIRWKKAKPLAVNVHLIDDVASSVVEALALAVPVQAAGLADTAPLAPKSELHEAVERLRRLHGSSSTSFFTSPCSNRIGDPEQSMCHFLVRGCGPNGEEPIGYVAYTEQTLAGMKLRVVLDDPVCAAAYLETVLRDFISDCDLAKVQPMFPCVKADVATMLRHLDFSTTMFGAEYALPLRTFELSKRQRKCLRTAPAFGLECRTTCADFDELAQLNESWLANRPCKKEVLFMTLPPSMPHCGADARQDEVRRIFTYQHGRLAGFMVADPYYRDGKLAGYVLNSTRFLPNPKPCWIPELMFASLIETLQSEGRADFVALGFSPCTELQPRSGEVEWLRRLFEGMWAGGDTIYSLHGLAEKKAYYCGGQGVRLQDKFIALPPGVTFNAVARFMVLLVGADVLKACTGKWFWSWAWSSVAGAVPSIPQAVREPFSCCTAPRDVSSELTVEEIVAE